MRLLLLPLLPLGGVGRLLVLVLLL